MVQLRVSYCIKCIMLLLIANTGSHEMVLPIIERNWR